MIGHTKKLNQIIITGRTFSGKEPEEVEHVTKLAPDEDLEIEVYGLATFIGIMLCNAIVMGKFTRRHMFDRLRPSCLKEIISYHTLSTNISYLKDEKI